MEIYDIACVKGFIRICNDGWLQGWHKRNGGHGRRQPGHLPLPRHQRYRSDLHTASNRPGFQPRLCGRAPPSAPWSSPRAWASAPGWCRAAPTFPWPPARRASRSTSRCSPWAAEATDATIAAVKKLSADVGVPADLKGILKEEDVQFLAESAFADACCPGNPRDTSVEEIKELYRSLL